MLSVFASPAKYVQGKDALKSGCHFIKELGDNALLICDEMVYGLVGKKLEQDLSQQITVLYAEFNGGSTLNEIDRLVTLSKSKGINVIIGLGGGQTIDAAKAVANTLDKPVVIIPTVASTDAPTSCISVIYTEDGLFDKYIYYKKHPDLVLVDTTVISQAPSRFLISGIADALSTWVEGRLISERHETTLMGGLPTIAAKTIAETCEKVLFEESLQAVAANDAKVVTPSLESVIEANTLLSGIGFESGGLAAAHSIHNGFSVLKGRIQTLTHGEKVAYGTLVQLALENRPKSELDRFITLYKQLGLPTTLKEMYLDKASCEELLKIGEQATKEGETIHKLGRNVKANDVVDGLVFVDSYVRTYFK